MTHQIIDNFLNQKDFDKIKSTFFPENENSEKLPWNYNKGIVRDPKLGPTGYEEHDWMYSHSFISSETKKKSEFFYLILPIFDKLNVNKIIDARANLLVPTESYIHHEDHVDRKIPHQVALFYVTTNNGFTVLNNLIDIECVENRMITFDGSIYHHSVTSTNSVRCVININYIPSIKLGNTKYFYS